jgi:hypothetical protein
MQSPTLHSLLVAAKTAELRRAAQRETLHSARGAHRRRAPRRTSPVSVGRELAVTIRYAFPDDAQALARLASLDSAPTPAQPVLVGELDGELRAALSLADGAVVADPFVATAGLVELLRARADQLRAGVSGRTGVRRARLTAWIGAPAWRAAILSEDSRDSRRGR